MAISTPSTHTLTSTEAAGLFLEALAPHELGVRAWRATFDEVDEVAWWECEVFDPYLPEGEDRVGSASFPEHWPDVAIHWG